MSVAQHLYTLKLQMEPTEQIHCVIVYTNVLSQVSELGNVRIALKYWRSLQNLICTFMNRISDVTYFPGVSDLCVGRMPESL
jgi:hypothetical protein